MSPPRILIVEDEHALARALAATVEQAGASSDIAPTAAQARRSLSSSGANYSAMILDIGLPDQNGLEFLKSMGESFKLPTIVITAHGEIQNTIAARKLGVMEFFQKPLDFEAFSNCLRRLVTASRKQLNADHPQSSETAAYIGAARSMRPVFQQIAHCCASDEPVLVRGETGSGKSHTARVIGTFGLRNQNAIRALVAGPSTPLEELVASLREAERGSLILEEVGQLSDPLQTELVRQIETHPQSLFPRLIATTSEDLHVAVRSGRLRSELFYRLQILEVRLPPLRQRMQDLPALVSFFLGQLKPGRRVTVSDSAMNRLCTYDWPGNLRELHNALSFALTMIAEATLIDTPHLPCHLATSQSKDDAGLLPAPLIGEMKAWLEQYFETTTQPHYHELASRLESTLIMELLNRYNGKLAPMAAALGANRSTLRRKLSEAES